MVLHPEVVANSVKIAYYLAKETDFLGKPLEKGKKITKDNKIITLAAGLARCYTLTKQNFFHASIFLLKFFLIFGCFKDCHRPM